MKPAKPTTPQLMIKKELPNPDTSQLSNTEKLTIYWIYPNENSPFMVRGTNFHVYVPILPSSHAPTRIPVKILPLVSGVQISTLHHPSPITHHPSLIIHHPSSNQPYPNPIPSL